MDQGEENTNTHTGVEFLFLDPSVVFFFFLKQYLLMRCVGCRKLSLQPRQRRME